MAESPARAATDSRSFSSAGSAALVARLHRAVRPSSSANAPRAGASHQRDARTLVAALHGDRRPWTNATSAATCERFSTPGSPSWQISCATRPDRTKCSGRPERDDGLERERARCALEGYCAAAGAGEAPAAGAPGCRCALDDHELDATVARVARTRVLLAERVRRTEANGIDLLRHAVGAKPGCNADGPLRRRAPDSAPVCRSRRCALRCARDECQGLCLRMSATFSRICDDGEISHSHDVLS